jgi:hypothetical protein
MSKTVINSLTTEVLGMEAPQKKAEWFDAEYKKSHNGEELGIQKDAAKE